MVKKSLRKKNTSSWAAADRRTLPQKRGLGENISSNSNRTLTTQMVKEFVALTRKEAEAVIGKKKPAHHT